MKKFERNTEDKVKNLEFAICVRDTTDIETLQLWLDEFLDADCTNEVFEVSHRSHQ